MKSIGKFLKKNQERKIAAREAAASKQGSPRSKKGASSSSTKPMASDS